ncbi:MAG: FecR domain-containing protein [Tannerella sp.]|jgi:ferric-dicitrate binding protein FerR (iron transport regulator)|nr:FecR domain-containing protein [Tannerella sp.]
MNTDYTKYTADELLGDDYFLRSEFYPTKESYTFWNRLHAGTPSLAKEIDAARLILRSLKRNYDKKKNLSSEDVEMLREKINRQNKTHDRRRNIRRLGVAASVAASICLILSTGWYLRFSRQQNETDYPALMKSFEQKTESASGQVQLVLSDNRKIDIDGKETQVDYNEEGLVNINSEQVIEEKTESKETAYNQLVVPTGKRSAITFSDGTRAWINSGSKIIYPITFEKSKRELFAEGEIYLDVAKDEKRPFIVKTGHMDITVLGTTLNVKAYGNESDMQIVLVCGKVEVELKGNKSVLSPNQMLSYNTQTGKTSVSSVDAADYVAWKDGYYLFKQQQLSAVLRKLSEYYGIAFEWDNTIDSLTCSGKLDMKEDLDEVLHTLEKTAPITICKTDGYIYRMNVKP